jgi:hypothetical protein
MFKAKLLTRDEFREQVFARDRHRCVVCGGPAVDAHHILERKLWGDGGYYLENGASVCEEHHIAAEQTVISCDDLREKCGITKLVLPEHLYRDQLYDKWGNPILPNGQRMKGELFTDVSVQKILGPVLHLFTNRVKYPRTYHLPWSPGVTKDDRVISDLSCFVDQPVVVTAKMDGENTTMYRDGIHARSLEYDPHPSRDWVKALHARIAHEIPENWRICGENLYARHSIHYAHLDDLFLVFSIWDGLRCLPWKDTVEYANMLGLRTVPVLVEGRTWDKGFDKELIDLGATLEKNGLNGDQAEGYVVRLADEFTYGAFRRSAGKYVRANHVQTHGHWIRQQLVPNQVGAKSDDGSVR